RRSHLAQDSPGHPERPAFSPSRKRGAQPTHQRERRPDRRGRHSSSGPPRRGDAGIAAPAGPAAPGRPAPRNVVEGLTGQSEMVKTKSKAAYMISAVAEQYEIHPQTLRLYEREGLLKPSRSEGNTRLYTDDDLERLEVILHLTRDLGVNLAGVEIILNMREKMGQMQAQIQEFIATLNRELVSRTAQRPVLVERTGLIPVLQSRTPTAKRAR